MGVGEVPPSSTGERPARRPDSIRSRPRREPPETPPWRVEGLPEHNGGPSPPRWPNWSRFWWVLLALLAINWIVSAMLLGPAPRPAVSYTFFTQQVDAGNVKEITSTADRIEGVFKQKVPYPPGAQDAKPVERFSTQRPSFANDPLLQNLQAKGVVVNANPPDQGPPVWEQVLLGFGPTLLFLGLMVWFFRRSAAAGGLGGIGGIGRSRAKLYQPEAGPRTTFDDVAGIDEVENEVMEIVDFLRDPGRYRRLGAQIPRGVLLSGPPGTGTSTPKTAYHCASAAPPSPLPDMETYRGKQRPADPDMSPCRGAGIGVWVAGSLTGVWRRRLFYARPA
ncbi:MAG TPA: ATP-dependent metallopeptidase FtsH/Yme1/Tma family protein [Pseudonocardiaceae bacterium]